MPSLGEAALVSAHEVMQPGAASLRRSVQEVVNQTLAGVNNVENARLARGWLGQVLIAAGRPRTVRQQTQVLKDALRNQTMYLADPVHMEWVQTATRTLCLKPGQCNPVGDCIPEGTLLLRDDYELVPIEKIKPGERIWGRDRWTTVQATKFKGKLQVDAIEMNNGSTVYLTGDHKVFVGRCRHGKGSECPTCIPAHRQESFDRIKVSDLGEQEVLLQPERIAFGEGTPDPDRLYMEGLALADGWVRDNCKCFYVAGRDGMRKEAQKHEVKAICDKLGIETRWHKRYIVVYDEVWAMRLAQLGERARFKHLETINLSEASAEAALRGLMADSTPNSNGQGGRTYSTTSPVMMLQVRLLHRMFGRSTSYKMLTPEQHGGAGKHPLWRVGVRQPSEGRASKTLMVRSIERAVKKVPCWDIETEDHYVYLAEHDVTVSNCDDLSTALATVTILAGIPTQFVEQHFDGAAQDHILIAVQDESGTWLKVDPSTDWPVGRSATATKETWIDPLQDVAPQLVGLGRVATVYETRFGKTWASRDGGHSWVEVQTLGDIPTAIVSSTMPYDVAAVDLQNEVVLAAAAGDTYLAAKDYAGAVKAYQAAGNAGATSVGPEIDLAGAPNVTQPLTQQAWTLNAALSAVNASTPTSVDAALAQGYVKKMVDLYQQAIAAGRRAIVAISPPGTPPSGDNTGALKALGVAAGAGVVGGLAYYFWQRSRRTREARR